MLHLRPFGRLLATSSDIADVDLIFSISRLKAAWLLLTL